MSAADECPLAAAIVAELERQAEKNIGYVGPVPHEPDKLVVDVHVDIPALCAAIRKHAESENNSP